MKSVTNRLTDLKTTQVEKAKLQGQLEALQAEKKKVEDEKDGLVNEARQNLVGALDKSEAITSDLATRLTNLKTTQDEKAALQRELDELQVRQKGLEAENNI